MGDAVSLLLRVGILMRSENECRCRQAASLLLQPSSCSSSSFSIPFHPQIHTKYALLVLVVPDFPFSLYLKFVC